jgi:hypothetical protein
MTTRTAIECDFEAEVLAAVVQSRWQEPSAAALRDHAASCSICSDTASVASAIGSSQATLSTPAALPDAGRVWWLAQLRARRESAQIAARPITVAQVVAGACAAGLAGATFGATSGWFQALLKSAAQWIAGSLPSAATLVSDHGILSLVAMGLLLLLVLIPAACWAIARE